MGLVIGLVIGAIVFSVLFSDEPGSESHHADVILIILAIIFLILIELAPVMVIGGIPTK